jgi:RsiW-degrading membrane proteinase PrsW (M82 family)
MILFADIDWTNPAFWIVLLFAVIPVYVLPAYLASTRNHPQTAAISVLTILLGWTFFGWAIAMVWAFTHQAASSERTSGSPH